MTSPSQSFPFDPFALTNSPARALGGIIRTGAVTYDALFSTTTNGVTVPELSRWIYVGTTGNLAYTKWDDTIETLPNLAAGVWHPICAKSINSSGSTIAANQLRWGS